MNILYICVRNLNNMKTLSNKQWYKNQLKVNKQLFELGMISHVEKLSQDIIAKSTYISQIKDSL